MSEEVLRFYQRGAQGGRGLRLRPKRPPIIRYTLLALLIAVPVAALWLTRDSWDMGQVIPKDQNYTIVFPNLIEGRQIIARSTLWELLPADSEWRAMQGELTRDFGLPEWLVNNFLVGPVYICGSDFESFKDAVLVTRMTRLGTLLQLFSSWSDRVEMDPAGGLDLRRVKDTDVLLAVRGRVLLVSRDRNALIRSLVLQPDDSMGPEGFEQTLASLKDEMMELRVRPGAWATAAPHVDAAELHVWMDDANARVVLASRLTEASRDLLQPLLQKARPAALPPALPGALQLSANLGMPAAESWSAIATLFGGTFDPAESVVQLLKPEARSVAGDALRGVLKDLGPSWSLTYRGVNPWAMLPMPKFAALFDSRTPWNSGMLTAMPSLPEGVQPWEAWPRPSEDKRYIHIPLPGGKDLEPVIAPFDGKLLVCTALPDALDLLATPALPADPGAKGNLLVEATPAALLQDALEVGLQLTDLGLIRGHDAESLRALFAPMQEAASRVPQLRLVAAHDDGVLTFDLQVKLSSSDSQPAL